MSRPTTPDWLAPHRGLSTDQPQAIDTTTSEGVAIAGEFTAVEGLGCSVRGLHVRPASPLPADVGELRARAENLTDALPGGMAVQELDSQAPSILLRTPARRTDENIEYEEAVVASSGVSVRRVEFSPETGRQPADLPMTWEQFDKLVESAERAVS